ncbi:pyruvate kinase [Sulfobacillus thermosulfidooxidans]|uniref:pyruvate kinase n=1 Tax=Sulfobacillus thermosulfidooxidans TaxID=28034 RepID=UPI00031A1A33|nr:pyruvate kinase [Sulfobacillus thermosulfidooxidans]
MRRTKIVATIGPACDDPQVIANMIRSGMDVARLNLSHGDLKTHRQRIQLLRSISHQLGTEVGIMLDTCGPEVRLTHLTQPLTLKQGDIFILTKTPEPGSYQAGVTWDGIFDMIEPGHLLWIDDGNIVMRCTDQQPDALRLEVVVGGLLQNRKKISSPDLTWPLDILTDTDRDALLMGMQEGMDFVAASFIRSAEDVVRIRKFFEENHFDVFLISKIENRAGVENLAEILAVSNGVMVARGDLGVELPPERVPWLQKDIIAQANELGIPVVTATQMLESMTHAPRPTRAEVSDVAHAIWDGSDSVMLSAETASGLYPVESIQMMAKIAEDADNRREFMTRRSLPITRVADAVSRASAEVAESLEARAILTVTATGYTARMVSRSRPSVPIIAISPNPGVVRRLKLTWGVCPISSEDAEHSDDMAAKAIEAAADYGYVAEGDLVVLTAGVPAGIPGTTNLVRVETVSNPVLVGTGLGYGEPITAPVRFQPKNHEDLPDEAYIAVAVDFDAEDKEFFAHAKAIIAEHSGRTSDIAVAAVTMGIPAIVGVQGASKRLHNGQIVTMDPIRGVIYKGRAKI